MLDDLRPPTADPGAAPSPTRLEDHVLVGLGGLDRRIARDLPRLIDPPIEGMRGSFGALLGLLPAAGARPSELAEAARISKQAVGQRLVELEERGWVVLSPDPRDRRARIVTRTPAGDEVRRITGAAIDALEARWAEEVGAERYATFRAVLRELSAGHAPTEAFSRRA